MNDVPEALTRAVKLGYLREAIEIACIGAGKEGYRNYPGSGGIWAGRNEQFADATFVDWGLAKATAIILNAAVRGDLVIKGGSHE